jgi:hypothetical protein
MKTRLFLTVAAFVAMTAIATAQTAQPATGQTGRGRAAGNVYADADKNGVCDNYTNGTRPGHRAYSAGANQSATNRGPGQGMAAGTGRGPGNGQGAAAGNGQGRYNGRGPAFVDTNNDGVCDNLATPAPKK